MATVKGTYEVSITWEIPDENIPDDTKEAWDNGMWDDCEVLAYFENNGTEIENKEPAMEFRTHFMTLEWGEE